MAFLFYILIIPNRKLEYFPIIYKYIVLSDIYYIVGCLDKVACDVIDSVVKNQVTTYYFDVNKCKYC